MKKLLALWLGMILFTLSAAQAAGYTLKLSATSIRLAPGESRTVSWSVEPVNLMEHTVTWTSDNPFVASVDKNGRITGNTPGTTVIFCTMETGTKSRVAVTVTGQPITTLSIPNNEITLEPGQSAQIEYEINENADDKRVKWSVDDKSVATVDSHGRVTAVGGGIATVTLLAANGMTAKAYIYVPSDVKKVEVHPETLSLGTGQTYPLDAYIFPGNAKNRDLTWDSTNTDVARVDSGGTVTAVGEGSCLVRAMTQNGSNAVCRVTVYPVPDSLTLSQTEVLLSKNKRSVVLSALIAPAEAASSPLTWESDNESVAKVENGKVTAVSYGRATVSAVALNGLKASCLVCVAEEPESVNFSQAVYMLPAGGEGVTLIPVFDPEGSLAIGLSYSSSDPEIASVDADGQVTPLSPGTCTIVLTAGKLKCQCEIRVYENTKTIYTPQSSVSVKQYECCEIQLFGDSGRPLSTSPVVRVEDESVCAYEDGMLYGLRPGRTRVTFSNPGTSVSTQISVTVLENPSKPVRCLSLTFDNGPGEYTDEILALLKKYDIKATFFMLGSSIEKLPGQAELFKGTSHEIGNHTYDNSSISSGSVAEVSEGLGKTDKLARNYTGKTPTLIRSSDALLPEWLFSSLVDSRTFVARGYDMGDAQSATAQEIIEKARANLYNTTMLTFHETSPETVKALETLIPELIRLGYRFLTVSELIEYTGNDQSLFSTKLK
ncbi:MAG: Ig-like domain-containing protein [Clostridiales bacterium]|nr:Ig-like domain-containing protein [Clostridiales bacterium]